MSPQVKQLAIEIHLRAYFQNRSNPDIPVTPMPECIALAETILSSLETN